LRTGGPAAATRAVLALVAGAVYPLGLAPFDWWPLLPASIAGLCLLLAETDARCAFRYSTCYGLGLFGVGASWVYVSIHDYGHAPPILATLLTALFVLVLALAFALPFLLYSYAVRRHASAALALFPAIWVLGEWFRGWLFTGFPWLYAGYGLGATWLASWAPVIGVIGLSWIAAFLAVTAAHLCSWRRQGRPATIAALAMAALLAGGWWLRDSEWTEAEAQPLSVAIVQPAIGLETKWNQQALDEILGGLLYQTEPFWQRDLIFWPESAVPRLRDHVSAFVDYLDSKAAQEHAALLTGIPSRAGEQVFNSVIALGDARGIYHKRHLVPFGEYVPLEQWLRGSIEFFDLPMSAFSSGPAQQPLLHAKGHAIATLICYEIVFPDLVAKTAVDASLLLTVSNDTWFGDSMGPYQHFQMARMRALENAKPLVRATNDGITAVIDHDGRVVASLPRAEPGVLDTSVLPRFGTTPFNRWGSLPVLAFSGLAIAIALADAAWHGRRRQLPGRLLSSGETSSAD